MITLSPICFALMTPNWVIIISLVSLRDGILLCVVAQKRKSDRVKFAILALTAKLTQTVPMAPPHRLNRTA